MEAILDTIRFRPHCPIRFLWVCRVWANPFWGAFKGNGVAQLPSRSLPNNCTVPLLATDLFQPLLEPISHICADLVPESADSLQQCGCVSKLGIPMVDFILRRPFKAISSARKYKGQDQWLMHYNKRYSKERVLPSGQSIWESLVHELSLKKQSITRSVRLR